MINGLPSELVEVIFSFLPERYKFMFLDIPGWTTQRTRKMIPRVDIIEYHLHYSERSDHRDKIMWNILKTCTDQTFPIRVKSVWVVHTERHHREYTQAFAGSVAYIMYNDLVDWYVTRKLRRKRFNFVREGGFCY